MDDIDSFEFDLWPSSPKYFSNNDDASSDLIVKLKDSTSFELKQPCSNLSILPSEDEMDFEPITCTYDCDQDIYVHPFSPERQAHVNIANDSCNNDHTNIKMFEKYSTPEDIKDFQADAPAIDSREKVYKIKNQADVPARDIKEKAPEAEIDKKEAKKVKNRMSAKRSRDRKREDLESDKKKNQKLENINKKLKADIGKLCWKAAYYETVKNHLCGIQEQNDDPYHITGQSEKVTLTCEDEEIISLIDSLECHGLRMKPGICSSLNPQIEEAQYKYQPVVYHNGTNVSETDGYRDVNFSVSNNESNVMNNDITAVYTLSSDNF